MAGKANKTQTELRPRLHGSSPVSCDVGLLEKGISSSVTTELTSGAFREEVVASLHKDIGESLKTKLRGALEGKMSAVRADTRAVGVELKSYQVTITRELTTLKGTVREMMKSLVSYTGDAVAPQREVWQLAALSELLQNKREDLESRSRRNKIKRREIPEGPGSCSTNAVSALLKNAFSLAEALMLNRAPRSLQPLKSGDPPCVTVARLHYHHECANILHLTREKQQITVAKMTMPVFPDYTSRVVKAGAEYNSIRQQLQGIEGVRFGILYLARFSIKYKDQDWIFSMLAEAQAYVT